jgi:hypothetical protein
MVAKLEVFPQAPIHKVLIWIRRDPVARARRIKRATHACSATWPLTFPQRSFQNALSGAPG